MEYNLFGLLLRSNSCTGFLVLVISLQNFNQGTVLVIFHRMIVEIKKGILFLKCTCCNTNKT